jgi:predicted transcriptional regulator
MIDTSESHLLSNDENGYVRMTAMTKLLEHAIERIRELPVQDQDALAMALLSITGEETALVQLDAETSAAIDEGLAQARRGEFVPDEVVTEANKRHGI